VDFERSLNAAVGKLRQTLNDSATQPRYIETVARKGYRFIASVTEHNLKAAPHDEEIRPALEREALSIRLPAWIGAAVAVGLLVWLIVSKLSPNPPDLKPVVWLDLDAGSSVSQPAISRDGMALVFVDGGRLKVRRLNQDLIRTLEGTEGASSPFFSPDGRWIGYFADHKLKKVAIEGGPSITLCNAPADRGGAWREDGQIIATFNTSGGLSIVPATGGTPQDFSDLKGEAVEVIDHRRPTLLPDGKGLLFVSTTGIATGSIRVLGGRGGAAKTLVAGSSAARYLASGYLLYHRTGTIFAAPMDLGRLELTGPAFPVVERVAHDHFRGAEFDVSAQGTLAYRSSAPSTHRAVAWMDASGVKSQILASAGAYSSPQLSPDGKKLAITNDESIWIHDLRERTSYRLSPDNTTACCPIWSRDGAYVVFSANQEIAWAKSNGSSVVERLKTPSGTSSVPFSFSPDGKWISIHRNEQITGYDIWVIPVERSGDGMQLGTPVALMRQAGVQAAPTISPDGKWLAYGSDDETGQMEVYVIPFRPKGTAQVVKRLVSSGGGRGPRWSLGSNEMFYRAPDESLMVAPIDLQGNSFHASKPRLWSRKVLSRVGPMPTFDLAGDGKRVVAILDADPRQPNDTHLRLLLNIDAALGRSSLREPK